MKRLIRFVLFSLLFAVSPAWTASTPIDQTRAVNADARVDISNVKGSVTVTGWDKSEVAITGALGDGAKELSVAGGSDRLVIKVVPPDQIDGFSWGADTRMGDTVLNVKVPKGAELKIVVVSANVALSGVGGRSLNVDSVNGKLRLDSTSRDIEIDSVSGNIDMRGSAQRAHLGSVSGNIRAQGLGGQIKIETVSGGIDADNGTYDAVKMGTVSGNVTLQGAPSKDAHVDIATMSGHIRVHLPAATSARLRASSFSGSIRSDFGAVKEKEHGMGNVLDTIAGSGEAQIKVQSFSGDIEIQKQ